MVTKLNFYSKKSCLKTINALLYFNICVTQDCPISYRQAMNKLQSAATNAMNKVKVANVLKSGGENDSDKSGVKELAGGLSAIAQSQRVSKIPAGALKPRGSIERESAFIIEGRLSNSPSSSRRRSSINPVEIDTPSEQDTFRLPDFNKTTGAVYNDDVNDDFVKVDNFLSDTLKTNSTNGMAIFGEPLEEVENEDNESDGDDSYDDDYNDDDDDVDEYSAETHR